VRYGTRALSPKPAASPTWPVRAELDPVTVGVKTVISAIRTFIDLSATTTAMDVVCNDAWPLRLMRLQPRAG